MDFSPFIQTGQRDRVGEIALLKKMNMGDFTLSNFKSTVVGDNVVVTFTMTVAQTIDAKQLPPKPAYRLSVWKKGASGWQWISHANFASIPLESLAVLMISRRKRGRGEARDNESKLNASVPLPHES